MFDLSWAESFVIIMVALLVIGPKELPTVIRTIRSTIAKAKNLSQDFLSEFKEIDELQSLRDDLEGVSGEMRHIVDLDGKLQPAYDVDDLAAIHADGKDKRKDDSDR